MVWLNYVSKAEGDWGHQTGHSVDQRLVIWRVCVEATPRMSTMPTPVYGVTAD